MGVIQVEPKPGSYVNEWRAAQIDRADMGGITRLLRPLGFYLSADLADPNGSVILAGNGIVMHAQVSDWLVVSPHDKVRVMDDSTFRREFLVVT